MEQIVKLPPNYRIGDVNKTNTTRTITSLFDPDSDLSA